ncbi:homeobox protein Hox-A13-like [Sycon ciliatum]|uniref:homeobox protein Hox-A13-like n=1 Tax=Sycon ciliatum TaxID=27933 RepID=UPI0031F6ECFB
MRNSLSTRNLEMIMAIKLDVPAVADFNYDKAAWHSEVTRHSTTATSTSSEGRDLARTPRAATPAASAATTAPSATAAPAAAAAPAAPAAGAAAAAAVATPPVLQFAEAFQQMVQQMPVGLAMQVMQWQPAATPQGFLFVFLSDDMTRLDPAGLHAPGTL